MNNDKFYEVNLRRWNELVDINAKSKRYGLDGFLSGNTSLLSIELDELGDVSGKSLLHLQCHFGMDTLSWARLGAIVTGIDFSNKAISLARELSNKLNITANFIESNIYDIPKILNKKYDIVFTSYGAICWLSDINKWAQIIGDCLKPRGIFYIIDGHPFGFMIDEKQDPFKIGYSYFPTGTPLYFEEGAYADSSVDLKNRASYEWEHSISDIVNALINANIEIEFIHEFPFTFFDIHPEMIQRNDKYWEFKNFKYTVPMMFSIKGKKKVNW